MVYLTRTTPALLASSPLTIQLFHCARLAFLRVCIYERLMVRYLSANTRIWLDKRLLQTFVTKHRYTYVLIGKSSSFIFFRSVQFSIIDGSFDRSTGKLENRKAAESCASSSFLYWHAQQRLGKIAYFYYRLM